MKIGDLVIFPNGHPPMLVIASRMSGCGPRTTCGDREQCQGQVDVLRTDGVTTVLCVNSSMKMGATIIPSVSRRS